MLARCPGYIRSIVVLAAAFALSACSTPQPLPIGEVISMARANPSDQVISRVRGSRVRGSKTSYGLRGADFARLAQRGVAAPVLDELQQSFVNSIDMLTRFSALGESYGGCNWCYPHPLDLANLDSGGNGMAAGLKGSQLAALSQQGVPDEALNALQEKFLAEYIEFARQRYQNYGKGAKKP